MRAPELGWTVLSPEDALAARGGSTSEVLLRTVVEAQLRRLNPITYKGRRYELSDGNAHEVVEKLRRLPEASLIQAGEKAYDLLMLGTSVEQEVEGDRKSPQVRYIDWKRPERNLFHVVPEFEVQRLDGSHYRPDLVLFVNSIPHPRVVLITDRKSLDRQIERTFRHCGKEPKRARTGTELADLLADPRHDVITALVNKFKTVAERKRIELESTNLFVLVDESHRTQYGTLHALMRKYGIERPELIIRKMKRRWGSCTPGGRVILNPHLVLAPTDCIDYVVIHELCHLMHPHHGRGFYDLLERVMPDWKERKRWLEEVQ